MRIPNWPALVCGWMLAAMIGQSVLAADPDDELPEISAAEGRGDFGPNGGAGLSGPYQPAPFAAGGQDGGGYLPPPGGYGAPGVPAQNAWPQTSPFTQHRIEQTFNDGGVWQYNSDDNFAHKWTFSLEYLYGHGAKTGNHLIGDPDLKNTPVLPDDVAITLFPSQTTALYAPMFHNGTRVWYGYENPDDSGMLFSGFILFENNESNKQFIQGEQNGFLQPLASIVVKSPDGAGVALPFDTRFFQQFTQEIMGADADYYFQPFFTRTAFKVKALLGAKYLRMSESLYVQGNDSGLGYDLDLAPPVFDPAIPFFPITTPYATIINSSVTNNLVGPTIGLRYDLGGDKFKIWGQSKFGVMADIESRSVSSSNLTQFKLVGPLAIDPNVQPGPAAILGPPPPTRVTSNHTHMAALFDQQFNIEFPLFSMIPLVNKMMLFKNADARIGWQYVVVSEVARAANQINYNLDGATINNNRTWFSYNVVNFGVKWTW